MALDRETVRKIAFLARIRVDDDRLDGLAGQLGDILGWVEQLSEVNTGNVEPMASVTDTPSPWRPDVVTQDNDRDAVLANAPAPEGGFYTVPKVVE